MQQLGEAPGVPPAALPAAERPSTPLDDMYNVPSSPVGGLLFDFNSPLGNLMDVFSTPPPSPRGSLPRAGSPSLAPSASPSNEPRWGSIGPDGFWRPPPPEQGDVDGATAHLHGPPQVCRLPRIAQTR
jgi:hypothetical protein